MRLEALAMGRVQGVGFRFFASQKAKKLGLKGFVKNVPDGSVEIVAEGKKSDLEKFLEELRKGTGLSRVESIKADWSKSVNEFTKFEVRH